MATLICEPAGPSEPRPETAVGTIRLVTVQGGKVVPVPAMVEGRQVFLPDRQRPGQDGRIRFEGIPLLTGALEDHYFEVTLSEGLASESWLASVTVEGEWLLADVAVTDPVEHDPVPLPALHGARHAPDGPDPIPGVGGGAPAPTEPPDISGKIAEWWAGDIEGDHGDVVSVVPDRAESGLVSPLETLEPLGFGAVTIDDEGPMPVRTWRTTAGSGMAFRFTADPEVTVTWVGVVFLQIPKGAPDNHAAVVVHTGGLEPLIDLGRFAPGPQSKERSLWVPDFGEGGSQQAGTLSRGEGHDRVVLFGVSIPGGEQSELRLQGEVQWLDADSWQQRPQVFSPDENEMFMVSSGTPDGDAWWHYLAVFEGTLTDADWWALRHWLGRQGVVLDPTPLRMPE